MADGPVRYLETMQTQHPDAAGDLSEFASLYQRKLWHPLTVRIEESLQSSQFLKSGLLVDMYNNFIAHFGHRINLLKLAHFAVLASQQLDDPAESGMAPAHCLAICKPPYHRSTLCSASQGSADPGSDAAAVTFLEKVQQQIADAKLYRTEAQPRLLIRAKVAEYKLDLGDVAGCKALQEECRQTLDSMQEVSPGLARCWSLLCVVACLHA